VFGGFGGGLWAATWTFFTLGHDRGGSRFDGGLGAGAAVLVLRGPVAIISLS